MVNLSGTNFARGTVGKQQLNLGTTVFRHGIDQRFTDPTCIEFVEQFGIGYGDIANDPASIDDERDIGRSYDETGNRLSIESGQGLPWRLESFHIMTVSVPSTQQLQQLFGSLHGVFTVDGRRVGTHFSHPVRMPGKGQSAHHDADVPIDRSTPNFADQRG